MGLLLKPCWGLLRLSRCPVVHSLQSTQEFWRALKSIHRPKEVKISTLLQIIRIKQKKYLKMTKTTKNSRASNNIIQNINIEITNLLLIIMRGRSARRAACRTLVSMLSFGSSVQGLYFRGLRSRVRVLGFGF